MNFSKRVLFRLGSALDLTASSSCRVNSNRLFERSLVIFCTLLLLLNFLSPSILADTGPEGISFPEQEEIDEIYAAAQPEGIVFLIMEQDEEALRWVVPRIERYTRQLRKKWEKLPIVVLSHGEEMMALLSEYHGLYQPLHEQVQRLINNYDVLFQVCGSYAYLSDIDPSEFPQYIDVVPFAPAEIDNYRQLEYRLVDMELTW